MKAVLYKAGSRGHANHGWLDTHHTFSFAGYYNPERVHFGALRVLNDDIVIGGEGFGTHPHDNMEIISIPLSGALEHRDSMGSHGIIHSGEVQVMSAGTGIEHSEFNASKMEPVNFLQLWIFPKSSDIAPRYDQKEFSKAERVNKFVAVVKPDKNGALSINQDAWLSLGDFKTGASAPYELHNDKDGVFVFVIEGKVKVGDYELSRRDGLGISDVPSITVEATSDAEVLLVEVPMF